MKEHRRKIQRRSRLLAGCRKWTLGFWGLRQYCFQRKRLSLLKRERKGTWTSLSLKRTKPCRRKVLWLQRKWVPEVFLSANPKQIVSFDSSTSPQKIPRSSFPRCRSGGPATEAEQLGGPSFRNEELLNKFCGLAVDSTVCQSKQYCTEASNAAFPVKEDGLARNRGESCNSEYSGIIVLNNSRRNLCCRDLKQNGTSDHLMVRRPRFKRCTLKRRSLFMMYKKLSMVKFRIRIAKFRPKFWRGKKCKLSKSRPSWVEKVTRDQQEDFYQGVFTDGSETLFSCWKLKSNSLQNLFSLSDMNNHLPGPLIEDSQTDVPDACLTQDALLQCRERHYKDLASRDQNGIAETCMPELRGTAACGAQAVHEETGEAPTLDSCPDIFISVMEKEISVSGRDDGESNQVMGTEKLVLVPCKVDLGINDDFANGPIRGELAQNEDGRSQMEVEGPISMDVFGVELLDHPYCKSPLDEPLRGSTGQKSGTQKSGKRSSQRASCVSDEQLAVWLCGFLDEVMKKYGSLVPLCERDVMGRLKEVYNEDFSHRKPFITKEIMKYQTRHPKSSTCNFRVFYNKHMLDMDDLTTLDGQNWLNDQIINMYGELIMDAVPDKVHFFNSFFHRQLVTKGYNGVKRWTKKVDLFKKTLLLIPIHLEVHWSLITVNLPNRIISFYDSQGIHFKFCVENIRKYLLTEAREKNHPDFLQGWQTAVTKCIPQQKNDSDCGVFVLQYCKCLALDQPFQFSQEDMPRVRKRIYKELCECRLID
ncbi:sentrin-specific protease 5 [Rhineura floridana]|uniref:sentrin-specific protease 5 n=1 Tax=Rhineura floridana TaxID=261503 RepID=UPI002AC7F0F6|nr:sentrin-specific protease 5 [Rhineura floridana]XP_061493408.1 sentrin-specific protease 5 [Rhineura floridana]XP_061493409.1 sentrin-specific protease 5 [Rhineura floridana]XP_061493410.1 sentrin-specific protease 5 [Rhineura floridana]